uniref:Amino acid transporter family protein n=1 Tax=Trepomonas sp. PC1 TaxID=1076344 RepID=A0A146KGX5_9EUKA|eukprot:JAP95114.1 Amino acid transporter family protein [Trepomonas sp. PC1]
MTEKKQTGSTSFTLLSGLVGASLLSCSFIVNKLGWVLTVSAFLLSISFSIFVSKHYVDLAHYTQASSYREMTEKIVSKKLSMALEICIIITYFGSVTAYIIISAQSVSGFILNVMNVTANPYLVKAIIAICVIFPLCLLKSLKQLAKIASVAIMAIFITAITIIVYFFMHVGTGVLCTFPEGQITYKLPVWPKVDILTSILYFLMYIPALQGNFACYTVIPNLCQELQGPPVMKKKIVFTSLIIAMIFALILFLSVGLMGAAMFGDSITDNILRSFKPCKWIWADIVSIIYACVVIVAYPLVLYPIKISIVKLAKKDPTSKQGYRVMVITSILFIVLSLGLAMVLESILTIFGLFSSISGILFYFLIPLLFYVKYPKIKAENIHLDHLQAGETVVDPVLVGVLSILAPSMNDQTVQRIRTASKIIFGGVIDRVDQDSTKISRTMSLFRQRAFSISIEENGNEKIRTHSIIKQEKPLQQHKDSLLDEMPKGLNLMIGQEEAQVQNELKAEEDSTVTVEENKVEQVDGTITGKRKVIGWTAIMISIGICVVGIIMNAQDVIKMFQ